ncbi:YlmG homolog protein 2 chloroplastic [Zea mays]|uniref:YlmG homolog protein 2 chloroplastic n=1 Tax=Zea mays TaxID=4577 RepID=A0A1D6PJ03_MAIZE|nr:YlmG homolog protein 2 chloroplastic [Zea mays]
MAASSADPAQHHASSRPPLLLAVRHLPFPGVPRTRTFPVPGPDVLAPLARRLEELASAAAAHPLLKPLFAAHSHLSSFSQHDTRFPRPQRLHQHGRRASRGAAKLLGNGAASPEDCCLTLLGAA